jgi:acylpyruvate hydrolase
MGVERVRNIWGIGRNYSEHAAELNNPVPASPLVFLKAGSCLQASRDELVFPFWLQDIHHELELAVQFGPNLEFSKAYLAMDFTDRELQENLKKKSHPWTLAKSFPGACALTDPLHVENLSELESLEFFLNVNGQHRQHGKVQDMIFSVEFLMDFVLQHFPVCPGDLILTGTPKGVGPVKNSDRLEVHCNRGVKQTWTVHQPRTRM